MNTATRLCSVLLAAQALHAACAQGSVTEASSAPMRGVPSHGQSVEIASCAGGPPIMLRPVDERALLDDAERPPVLAEMLTRFPILARDRFAPPVLMLWHKELDDWRYVSLQPDAFTGSGTLCFTATFVAQVFPQTPALMNKYFAREMPTLPAPRARTPQAAPRPDEGDDGDL